MSLLVSKKSYTPVSFFFFFQLGRSILFHLGIDRRDPPFFSLMLVTQFAIRRFTYIVVPHPPPSAPFPRPCHSLQAGSETETQPVRPGPTQAVHGHEKVPCPAEPRRSPSCRDRLPERVAELLRRVGPVGVVENRGVRRPSGLRNRRPQAGGGVRTRNGGFSGIPDGRFFAGCHPVSNASAADSAHYGVC